MRVRSWTAGFERKAGEESLMDDLLFQFTEFLRSTQLTELALCVAVGFVVAAVAGVIRSEHHTHRADGETSADSPADTDEQKMEPVQ